VPIDTSTSEGADFKELGEALFHRHPRLERLDRYVKGEPPLPESLANLRDVARDFFKTSRTNFAELVQEAPRERMTPTGIRTAVANGESGDAEAWARWKAARLPILQADVHTSMLGLGDAYVIVAPAKTPGGSPIVTAEDPRQVITLHDPETDAIRLAMKLYRDGRSKQDIAYMYRPGQVFRATKPNRDRSSGLGDFNPNDWTWDEAKSAPYPKGFEDVMPVVRFKNRGCTEDGSGVGEFERHIDVLDRINRTLLRGLVIMTYQAFKQRAAIGDLPERDDEGNLINYQELLKAGPDALWLLPPDAKIWESGQVAMDPIISFAKNDVLFLAAVTRTPLAMFTPDAATQSAEGAAFQREGLVYRTEDRITRASESWSQVMSLIFRFAGDLDRAPAERIELMWAPVERYSISDQANAVAQTKGVLPRREQLIRFLGMTPQQADQALSELAEDLLLDQQYALGLKAATGSVTNVTNNNAAA
jgi:hypothetical protein